MNEELDKLVDLLYSYLEAKGIENFEINNYMGVFEFIFDISNLPLTGLGRILAILNSLSMDTLSAYDAQLELYDNELIVFFEAINKD